MRQNRRAAKDRDEAGHDHEVNGEAPDRLERLERLERHQARIEEMLVPLGGR